MARAQAGVYDSDGYGFSAGDAAAAEIALANGGLGPCGPADEYGRCSSRYHALECSHGQSVDWLASGPHPETGEAALANLEDSMALAGIGTGHVVWGDADDPDEPSWAVPQQTVELATALTHDWGLDTDTPGFGDPGGWQDSIRPPATPVSVADALLASAGFEPPPPPEQPGYPGIAEIRRQLGI